MSLEFTLLRSNDHYSLQCPTRGEDRLPSPSHQDCLKAAKIEIRNKEPHFAHPNWTNSSSLLCAVHISPTKLLVAGQTESIYAHYQFDITNPTGLPVRVSLDNPIPKEYSWGLVQHGEHTVILHRNGTIYIRKGQELVFQSTMMVKQFTLDDSRFSNRNRSYCKVKNLLYFINRGSALLAWNIDEVIRSRKEPESVELFSQLEDFTICGKTIYCLGANGELTNLSSKRVCLLDSSHGPRFSCIRAKYGRIIVGASDLGKTNTFLLLNASFQLKSSVDVDLQGLAWAPEQYPHTMYLFERYNHLVVLSASYYDYFDLLLVSRWKLVKLGARVLFSPRNTGHYVDVFVPEIDGRKKKASQWLLGLGTHTFTRFELS